MAARPVRESSSNCGTSSVAVTGDRGRGVRRLKISYYAARRPGHGQQLPDGPLGFPRGKPRIRLAEMGAQEVWPDHYAQDDLPPG